MNAFMANMAAKARRALFGGALPVSNDAKREAAWADYGYPDQLGFINHWSMFKRNGIARAGVMRHVEKTWETDPWIVEGMAGDKPHRETRWEREVAALLKQLQLWNRFYAADWRNRVGRYAGLYLVFDDGKLPSMPVTGARRLLKVQPLFESQLKIIEVDQNPASLNYGNPLRYEFQTAAPGDANEFTASSVTLHADRVHILAEGADDGSVFGIPCNEAGFNDLITMEKIIGAGGEGFWKAARQAPRLSGEDGVDINSLMQFYGVDSADQLADKIDETIGDYQSGFDKALMLGGLKAEQPTFSVPSPEHFFAVAMQSYAAGHSCPMPILLGQQIAQRSSDENSKEWAQTVMTRRRRFVGPNVEELIRRLMRFGVIPEAQEFHVAWDDLTDATFTEKLANAKTMADANKAMTGTGEAPPFRSEEVREAVGLEAEPAATADDDPPEGE